MSVNGSGAAVYVCVCMYTRKVEMLPEGQIELKNRNIKQLLESAKSSWKLFDFKPDDETVD